MSNVEDPQKREVKLRILWNAAQAFCRTRATWARNVSRWSNITPNNLYSDNAARGRAPKQTRSRQRVGKSANVIVPHLSLLVSNLSLHFRFFKFRYFGQNPWSKCVDASLTLSWNADTLMSSANNPVLCSSEIKSAGKRSPKYRLNNIGERHEPWGKSKLKFFLIWAYPLYTNRRKTLGKKSDDPR